MIDIIKAKLARGGFVKPGEAVLVIKDMLDVVISMQEKIHELEQKLDTIARRSDRGSKKSSPKPEVQPESDK